MSLKFYFDTHIPKQVALQLRSRGVEVVRCEEVGMQDASDYEHLTYATEHELTLVSIDKDFHRHYKEWSENDKPHTGIISVSSALQGKRAIGKLMTALHDFWLLIEAGAGTQEEDIHNRMIFLK